jgi:hypothetical protein
MLPQLIAGLNGFVPPSPVELHVDDIVPDLQFPPSPVDDPIEQFSTTDDETVEDDDLLSVAESATDSTASADSLPGYDDDDDSGHQLFSHRLLRWNNMMAAFADISLATVPAPPSPSYSQATTLRYVLSPVDEQVVLSPPTATPVIDSDDEVELLGPASKRQRLEDPEDTGFQITVKTLSGSTLLLWVENADTILQIKHQIIWLLGWIFSQPRDLILVLGGIQLEDARTLPECGITSGTQLTLVLRLRGGMDNADDVDPFSDLDTSMPEDTGGAAGSAFDGPPAPLPPLELDDVPMVVAAVAVPQVIRTNSSMILATPLDM